MSILGRKKTEATYRALLLDSSSSLKEFSMNRRKYHKKYVLNERVEDEDTKAATIGRVVETLLLEPQEFDGRFHMSTCLSAPTGLMLEFVEALYKHTSQATDDMGNVTRSFEDISRDAYVDSGFKIKYEAVLAKFVGSDAEIFYKEIREVRAKKLTVVTADDVSNAEKIVYELRTNFVTADIVNLISSSRYTVHNQFQIEGYSVDSHLFKSMLDKMVIDHSEKKIFIYDLKCTWSVENFLEEYYLYRRSYIQAYLYFHAVKSLTIDSESELSGYDVEFPRFIVCDSTNYFSPLIYTMNQSDILDAYHGFEHKGRKYPGVKQIIQDLKWAIDNDVWNISRENYIANGMINIKGGN
jgi:hypothetical protein